eukprot:8942566-Alexandrium_andersonii.AAC.1
MFAPAHIHATNNSTALETRRASLPTRPAANKRLLWQPLVLNGQLNVPCATANIEAIGWRPPEATRGRQLLPQLALWVTEPNPGVDRLVGKTHLLYPHGMLGRREKVHTTATPGDWGNEPRWEKLPVTFGGHPCSSDDAYDRTKTGFRTGRSGVVVLMSDRATLSQARAPKPLSMRELIKSTLQEGRTKFGRPVGRGA